MPLVNAVEILQVAERQKRAAAAINVHSLDVIPRLVEVAEQIQVPLILQVSWGSIRFMGLDNIVALTRAAAEDSTQPICLHLDHAESLEQVRAAVGAGFTSVMIDGSKLPFDANAALTGEVCALARPAGVSVEGELGRVLARGETPVDNPQALFTVPEEAARFVELTGVDSLAVAVGTQHGPYAIEPQVDLQRIQAIREATRHHPLVLHGASGLSDQLVADAIRSGIRKVNFSTDLKAAWAQALRETIAADPHETDPRALLAPALASAIQVAEEKLRLSWGTGRDR